MDTASENKAEVFDIIKTINDWSDTPEGRQHKQFLLSMLITLNHSKGLAPIAEVRKNKGLALLWPKDGKHYGVLLDPSGSIVNICKEEDGRLFASTKINS